MAHRLAREVAAIAQESLRTCRRVAEDLDRIVEGDATAPSEQDLVNGLFEHGIRPGLRVAQRRHGMFGWIWGGVLQRALRRIHRSMAAEASTEPWQGASEAACEAAAWVRNLAAWEDRLRRGSRVLRYHVMFPVALAFFLIVGLQVFPLV
ncbi:MAG: hypothetical protein AAGA48_37105 [Myxococcota bacterium]